MKKSHQKTPKEVQQQWKEVNPRFSEYNVEFYPCIVNSSLEELQSPLDFFSLLFDDDCLECIEYFTNLSYNTKIRAKSKPCFQDDIWQPVTKDEIKKYKKESSVQNGSRLTVLASRFSIDSGSE